MPRSAIATGLVDYELPVEQMPATLLEYVEHAHLRGGPIPVPAGTRNDPLHAILALLCTREGHDFRCYKKAMLLRRIQRRMGLNRIAAIDDYCQYLRDTPPEIKALAKDLLIGVTEFFREPEAWAVLEEEVLPHLVAAKHPEAPLRVWVTGCATGEEAYSIGMCLLDRVANSERNGKLQIFATDIDSHALEIARPGIYPESIASSIAPERLTPFFTRADNSYRVKKELREACLHRRTSSPMPLLAPRPHHLPQSAHLSRARAAAEGHRAVPFRSQPKRLSILGEVRDRRPATEPVRAALEEVADLPA